MTTIPELFNFNNKTYEKCMDYIKTNIVDPYRFDVKLLVSSRLLLKRKVCSQEFSSLFISKGVKYDCKQYFNPDNYSKLRKAKFICKDKINKWVVFDTKRHKKLKLNLYVYKVIKEFGLSIYHDDNFRSNPFCLFLGDELVGLALPIYDIAWKD